MVDVPTSKATDAAALTGDELVLVSELSSSVTITGTTISAAASDNSYNDSGNGFVTAGFAVGNYVNVVGFTGNTANNIFSAKITALTAGKMTIGGTDGDVIVDDAAGESVTITKWVSRRTTTDTIRDLPPTFRGARVRMNADDTAQNITTETDITFDVADFDTDSFWSGGAPTRITIPAGVTYVELVGQVHVSSGTADTGFISRIFHRNSGSTILRSFGTPGLVEQSGTVRGHTVATGPVAVASGDYFTLTAREETDTSVTIEGNDTHETYLSILVLS